MSFKTMKPAELRTVVEQFVGEDEAKITKTKPAMLALLEDEGVTYEMYSQWSDDVVDEAKEEDLDIPQRTSSLKRRGKVKEVIVKMTRNNPTYQVQGITFTKEHPFAVMDEEKAQDIFDVTEGFRLATPREAQEYYN